MIGWDESSTSPAEPTVTHTAAALCAPNEMRLAVRADWTSTFCHSYLAAGNYKEIYKRACLKINLFGFFFTRKKPQKHKSRIQNCSCKSWQPVEGGVVDRRCCVYLCKMVVRGVITDRVRQSNPVEIYPWESKCMPQGSITQHNQVLLTHEQL